LVIYAYGLGESDIAEIKNWETISLEDISHLITPEDTEINFYSKMMDDALQKANVVLHFHSRVRVMDVNETLHLLEFCKNNSFIGALLPNDTVFISTHLTPLKISGFFLKKIQKF
jgi:hypothetical protein